MTGLLTAPGYDKVAVLFEQHIQRITSAEFLEKDIVCLSCADRTIRIFDLQDFQPGLVIKCDKRQSQAYPTAICINEIQLVAGFSNGDLVIYDVENGDELLKIAQADRVSVTSVSAMKTQICVGGLEGDVRVWDLRTQHIVTQLKPHQGRVTKVQFVKDQDGRLVCFSAGDDRYFVATCNGAHVFDCQLSG